MAQWIERWPAEWKIPGSIPVKGMYLGCGHIPVRGVQEAAGWWFSLIDVSNSLSFSLPPCKKINKIYIFLRRMHVKCLALGWHMGNSQEMWTIIWNPQFPFYHNLPVYPWTNPYEEANENMETINCPLMLGLSIINRVIENGPKLWKMKALSNSRYFGVCTWSLHMFDHRWLSVSGKAKLQSRYSQIRQCLL